MKHTREKKNGMTRSIRMLAVLLVPVVVLIIGAAAPAGWAQDEADCWFNIEFNATDLDVGVRGFFDYEPWTNLQIFGPAILASNRQLANVQALNNLSLQGFAEWFFESGEPTLADVPFSTFLPRFPAGDYVFDAVPIVGAPVDCTAAFTHVIPCEPEISAAGNRGLGVTISWDPVTTVVDPGQTPNEDDEVECVPPGDLEQSLTIVGYEVIVETEDEKRYTIELPGDATSVKVPPEFIALGEEFQYEVLAIEESGNQTITEEDFCLNERNGHVEECED